jgi:hypothetical protein
MYIKVVQGRRIRPSTGQRNEPLKAILHNAGLAIHQSAPAKRGPNRSSRVKKQHIVIFFLARSKSHLGRWNERLSLEFFHAVVFHDGHSPRADKLEVNSQTGHDQEQDGHQW